MPRSEDEFEPRAVTKQELFERVETVLKSIAAASTRQIMPFMALPLIRLTEHCVDLQKEILDADGSLQLLLELKKRVIRIETIHASRASALTILPVAAAVYLGGGAIFYVLTRFDLARFASTTLGVQAPEKLISLGILGAFLYLATSLLRSQEVVGSQASRIVDFGIRLFLAIIVPVVLVGLFFNEEGTIKKLALSPEILSFACGYSAKLVVDIFNKLVEKGSNMIAAM